MAVDVKVPGVGESVQEGMIESWKKSSGDWVEMDDVLCELETDKATVEVVAETAGSLEVVIEAGSVVQVGDVIARIDANGSKPAASAPAASAPAPAATPAPAPATNAAPAHQPGPAAVHVAAREGVDLSKVQGTGKDGRPTKGDVLAHAAQSPSTAPAQPSAPAPKAAAPEPIAIGGPERREDRKPMSMIRRRIAQRLIESQQTAAILTTFNEVDMTAIMELRSRYKDDFQKKHDVKLGFMGFFLKASVEALQTYPAVNAYLDDTDICYHNYCDIGVAVSTQKGLMVPIIRDVDKLSLAGVEQSLAGFAVKARENKISLDDLTGGTFTVSNGGVFGSLLSTPIINPPQTAILGMHKTQMRPMVMPDGKIEARPMMYLALSYDHRLIDGKEAVGFLVKIKECLEDPSRILLGV